MNAGSLTSDRHGDWLLRALLLAYLGASLLHFVHNAEYVHDYPNLPTSISRASVYFVWLGITVVGAAGYVLYSRRGYRTGLLLMAVYATAGLDGLLHYTRAPFGAHTAAMNFTILFEVLIAAILLVALLFTALSPQGTR